MFISGQEVYSLNDRMEIVKGVVFKHPTICQLIICKPKPGSSGYAVEPPRSGWLGWYPSLAALLEAETGRIMESAERKVAQLKALCEAAK